MISGALHKLINNSGSLAREEARAVMAQILSGGATDAQVAALLTALHMKGETVEEIVGFAEAVRMASTFQGHTLDSSGAERDIVVDTCGTGGDGSGSFNISTAAAFVVAGANTKVAKHGNRSVSSKCGSADVIEALGVNLAAAPAMLARCLREIGIVFLFAPSLHPAMKRVQPIRRDLKLRSTFNLLGPLTNPAQASAQVIGVYSDHLVEKLSRALILLGLRRSLVVHGSDGLDEITITGPTKVGEVRGEWLRLYEVTPEEIGFKRASRDAIAGGDVQQNARIIRDILHGKKSPCRDVVLMNAAAALMAAGRADSLGKAMPLAVDSLDSGAARTKLNLLVEFTNRSEWLDHNCPSALRVLCEER
jgi:anthranilate phosphoribosyltransferase